MSSKTCILVKKKAKNIIVKSKHSVQKVVCPCRGEYNYQCENIYCTINDMVCDYLMKVNSTKRVALNFQICMNHNQTLKFIWNFFFYYYQNLKKNLFLKFIIYKIFLLK